MQPVHLVQSDNEYLSDVFQQIWLVHGVSDNATLKGSEF